MAVCEKCWGDAYIRHLSNPDKSQSEHYSDLIKENINCEGWKVKELKPTPNKNSVLKLAETDKLI